MSKHIMRRSRRRKPGRTLVTGLGTLVGAAASLAAGWIAYSKLAINHQEVLPKAIAADREILFSESAGRISYYTNRSQPGRPLVLVHSVNAAASAYEMMPLFEFFRSQRPVYALDLPGFGFSERSPRRYSPQLYADAINEFLAADVKQPADVIALSLSSEFAARAAVDSPQLFHSLVMISPTGLGEDQEERKSQQLASEGVPQSTYKALSFPLWGQALFDLIATRSSIRYFLQQSFIGPVPEALVDYAYATSHQPGAHYAPLHFIGGVLFTPAVRRRYYQSLQVPSLILYDRDAFSGFSQLPALVQSSEWIEAARVVNTCGLPQFEKLDETAAELQRFWQSIPEPSQG